MIKAITEQTGVKIDVQDDGTVNVASHDSAAVAKAIEIIQNLTLEPEIGQKFKGIVRRVENYGVFVEIAPGKEGLLHVTDMSWTYVKNVEDIAKLGDELEVVVSDIDREGRIKVSRKSLLEKPENYEELKRENRRDERPRGGGGRDRDRGGRRFGGGGGGGGEGGGQRDRGEGYRGRQRDD
jgi:polyribonucleotide nucleotidyltransferase